MTNIYNTIPKHRIITSYYEYVAIFWLTKASNVQKEIGIESYKNGLTPDVVKFNDEYRLYYKKAVCANKCAKMHVPNAKELRTIIKEYHKRFDMGQRIKINSVIGDCHTKLMKLDYIVDKDHYHNTLSKHFEEFKLG